MHGPGRAVGLAWQGLYGVAGVRLAWRQGRAREKAGGRAGVRRAGGAFAHALPRENQGSERERGAGRSLLCPGEPFYRAVGPALRSTTRQCSGCYSCVKDAETQWGLHLSDTSNFSSLCICAALTAVPVVDVGPDRPAVSGPLFLCQGCGDPSRAYVQVTQDFTHTHPSFID